ncbi:MAG: hypothetical protein Q8R12_03510 [bacterium]|nr:hypothetical protein [bacterium]
MEKGTGVKVGEKFVAGHTNFSDWRRFAQTGGDEFALVFHEGDKQWKILATNAIENCLNSLKSMIMAIPENAGFKFVVLHYTELHRLDDID